jgi:hypothetical protein
MPGILASDYEVHVLISQPEQGLLAVGRSDRPVPGRSQQILQDLANALVVIDDQDGPLPIHAISEAEGQHPRDIRAQGCRA